MPSIVPRNTVYLIEPTCSHYLTASYQHILSQCELSLAQRGGCKRMKLVDSVCTEPCDPNSNSELTRSLKCGHIETHIIFTSHLQMVRQGEVE